MKIRRTFVTFFAAVVLALGIYGSALAASYYLPINQYCSNGAKVGISAQGTIKVIYYTPSTTYYGYFGFGPGMSRSITIPYSSYYNGVRAETASADAAIVVVSSGFRGLPAIMFGIIANDDQVKDDQATHIIGKGANFIGFGAKLAEEAFQQVR
jgi:hypothetical protein